MAITTKTTAALLGIFLALFGGAMLILQSAVLPGFTQLEAENHAADRARVEANLRALGEELTVRVTDYATWDDCYAFFRGEMPAFPADNFYPSWFEDYGVDVVVLADDVGRPLWAGERTLDGQLTRPDPALTRALLLQARRSLPALSGHGVVWTEGGPMIVAAARSTGDAGAQRPRGQVIFGKRMSAETLRQQTQLDVALIDAHTPNAALAAQLTALEHANTSTWTTEDTLYSLIALREADGDLSGAVLAQRARDLSALGTRSISMALLLFSCILALAIVAIWVLLRVGVINRLSRLQRHIDDQHGEVLPIPQRRPHGGDEIARLTTAYNNLVQRVQDAAARERLAHREREAAAASNKMKSDFMANISHRLRGPLDAVIGYAELIDEELADAKLESPRVDLRRVTGSARQLLALINEIHDLSKIEAGRMEINPEAFRVDEMLSEAVSAAPQPEAIDSSADANIGSAYSDQKRLRQCLVNVLLHAIRFAQDGRASLRARRIKAADGRDTLRFEIRYSGASISPEELEHAFEPFAAAASGTMGGPGLNLAITRKLAELLGGNLEASSQLGGGAVFVLCLPALLDEQARNDSALAQVA